jgi:hypothetical protein
MTSVTMSHERGYEMKQRRLITLVILCVGIAATLLLHSTHGNGGSMA